MLHHCHFELNTCFKYLFWMLYVHGYWIAPHTWKNSSSYPLFNNTLIYILIFVLCITVHTIYDIGINSIKFGKSKWCVSKCLLVIASLCSYNVEMARILFKEFRLFSHSFNFAAKLIIETKYYVGIFLDEWLVTSSRKRKGRMQSKDGGRAKLSGAGRWR